VKISEVVRCMSYSRWIGAGIPRVGHGRQHSGPTRSWVAMEARPDFQWNKVETIFLTETAPELRCVEGAWFSEG
jgi:hypothetical protein